MNEELERLGGSCLSPYSQPKDFLMIDNNQLQKASNIVNNLPYSAKNWREAYDITARHHPWEQEKINQIINKSKNELKSFNILTPYEQLAEKEFPFDCGVILEIGAHIGRFLLYKVLNYQNIFAVGIDASSEITVESIRLLEKLKINHEWDALIRYTLLGEEIDNLARSFDRIYAFETLEHVGDLNLVLKNIHCKLRPKGDLVFSLPLNNYANSGFHTQRHDKQTWLNLLVQYFEIDKIIDIDNNNGILGRLVKKN